MLKPDQPIGFGEIKIKHLCKRINLHVGKIKNCYKKPYQDPKSFNSSIQLHKADSPTGDCERGFSLMNLIITLS